MIKDGLNGHADIKWHLTWIQHFSRQLAEGIWYPRWLAGTNYGYGSPTFVFQPPLVFYLGSLLKFSGLDAQNTIIFLFSLALFLSGLTFYIYGRKKWGIFASLVGALAYMTAPYLAFDINWRGGLASIFVQALIPLIWHSTEQSLSYSKSRLTLAIAWTATALTHVPSLLLCAVVWLPYTLLALLKKPWKSVVSTLITAGIGLGMASIFLLPAVVEKSLINTEFMKGEHGGIAETLIGGGIKLFSSNLIAYIFVHQSLAIAIFTIIAFIGCRIGGGNGREIWHWLIFAISLAFLTSSLSEPIWQSSPTLQNIIFAWRLLAIFSFVGAVLCAVTVREIIKLRPSRKLVLSLGIVGVLLMNFRYTYQLSRQFPTLRNPGRANIEHLKHIQTIINDPYTDKLRDYKGYIPLLKNGSPSPSPVIGEPQISIVNGQAQTQIEQWNSYERLFKITAATPSTIRVRTFYYPAWHLYLNQKPHPIVMSDDGTIKFTLEPGLYEVVLRYQWTPAFIAGVIISILSVFLLTGFVVLIG
ncbi:hypothetical protein NSMS1_58620 [Nostoc sp. MS1]|nr:hypothetical protein NSMS1_58620 [Nostoc sp. MS1]